jgi:hypothetical protein
MQAAMGTAAHQESSAEILSDLRNVEAGYTARLTHLSDQIGPVLVAQHRVQNVLNGGLANMQTKIHETVTEVGRRKSIS